MSMAFPRYLHIFLKNKQYSKYSMTSGKTKKKKRKPVEKKKILILILLNPDRPSIANSEDPDQLASSEAN